MLDGQKLKIIHVAQRQVGLSEEQYRDLLWQVAGVRSSRELALADFNTVMRRFTALGFVSTSKRKPLTPRAGMASPGQVQKVWALWNRYTEGEGDDTTLGKWLDHKFHISSVRFVSAELAPKLITALISMTDRKAAKAAEAGPHAA